MTIPADMFAIRIRDPGRETGRLEPGNVPTPNPAEGEVLIRVSHAGVNRADIFQRMGLYPPPDGASPLPGLEVSGTIVALGRGVTRWAIGDAVCALVPGGGYATYATAPSDCLLPIPRGWTMAEAAALPEALFTVWMALGAEMGLKAGERFLVHGGASGIGMTAIQYARAVGATVFATAGTPEKCAACVEWGATKGIDYKHADFVEEVLVATEGRGVDVILDFIGGDYIARNFRCLAISGRMISLAFLRGANIDALNVAPLLLKRLTWKGTTLRARSIEEKAVYAHSIRSKIWRFVEDGTIRPVIHAVFPLEEAARAQNCMEQNLNIGKIVLRI